MPKLIIPKPLTIRAAMEKDHKDILKVSKLTKWTKDFSNQVMFSSSAAYEKGWITVARLGQQIVGFACFREKKRTPEVVLYFVGVSTERQGQGIGWRLVEDMMERVDHRILVLKCAKDNVGARRFYLNKGFAITAEDEKYWTMQLDFSQKKTPGGKPGVIQSCG